ncbi:matrixin family metalloprotease [Candidatus Magnetobacterium casense]|uniref:Matrixin family metalloprotease n=1 Tax=Candidatus Magnetobacterium casense TaxID=1455061 RepID=A0ABS6S112_9BACT|nr:matrixin family metalloprotease [Candidatus Magnetobacterium casensis]MBV6342541.1 matrixin family metalloprotease [Candidatus Magnetobacterium casensis]
MVRFRALFLCLCVLWSSEVLAFGLNKTSSGAILKQKQPGVTLYVNATGGPTGALEAITAAMQTWNSVTTTSFRYTYAGATTATNCGDNDGVNIMCFNNNTNGSLAVNSVWYDPPTGEIFDDDINFNTKYLYSTDLTLNSYDLQSIAAHELGHCLSLKDLYDAAVDSEKTMYGYASRGETKKRTLEQDDMAGITSLYPASGCTYSISPVTETVPAQGGSGTITVTAENGCGWIATPEVSWLSITSGSTGSGNGTVTYSASANRASTSRTGTINISGETFTVTEEGDTGTVKPMITGNGVAGYLTVKSTDTLNIDVSLTSGSKDGTMADWWIYAITPFGTYYYVYPNQWLAAAHAYDVRPAYKGALFNLQSTRLLSASGLPSGYYYIYFGVDTSANGMLNLSTLIYNTLTVYVPY